MKKTRAKAKTVKKPGKKLTPKSSSASAKKKVDATSTELSAATLKPPKPKIIIPERRERDYTALLSKDARPKVKNVLIAQPAPEGNKSPYFALAEKYKIKFHFHPFIDVEGIPGRDFRKQRIPLNDYSGIIFTSRQAIDHFFRICDELRVKMSQETKFFCTSEVIALYLQTYTQYRKRKVFFGNLQNNKELRSLLFKHKEGTKFLYICAEERKQDEIPTFLTANGFNFREAYMFKTVPKNLKELKLEMYDILVFFSPTAIDALYHNFPNFKQGDLRLGAYGKTTADALAERKLKMSVMAPLKHDIVIAQALDNYLKESNG